MTGSATAKGSEFDRSTRATVRSRKRPLKKKEGIRTLQALTPHEERRRRGAGVREHGEAGGKYMFWFFFVVLLYYVI
ncbi:hypothetical protein NDU88_004686 [Pleurodeles waltl]|uniref:Uncharacterized protein n=1 Tax=Pleurodeles waltl TaxID=8319 RepID=A0AAV7W7E2_PLEWA|nr:hypothetical protein NDU88_004686 [Pleurodeles waltl]